VAVAIVIYIWIHNLAFNIPLLVYTTIRRLGVLTCAPFDAGSGYILTTRLVNFYLPLFQTWMSYIGIIYEFKRSVNKVFSVVSRSMLVMSQLPMSYRIYLVSRTCWL